MMLATRGLFSEPSFWLKRRAPRYIHDGLEIFAKHNKFFEFSTPTIGYEVYEAFIKVRSYSTP